MIIREVIEVLDVSKKAEASIKAVMPYGDGYGQVIRNETSKNVSKDK